MDNPKTTIALLVAAICFSVVPMTASAKLSDYVVAIPDKEMSAQEIIRAARDGRLAVITEEHQTFRVKLVGSQ